MNKQHRIGRSIDFFSTLENANAVVVAADEDIVVVDNFLVEEDYRNLREFLVCSDYKHINTITLTSTSYQI